MTVQTTSVQEKLVKIARKIEIVVKVAIEKNAVKNQERKFRATNSMTTATRTKKNENEKKENEGVIGKKTKKKGELSFVIIARIILG